MTGLGADRRSQRQSLGMKSNIALSLVFPGACRAFK